MREAREYLDYREVSRKEKPVGGGLQFGAFIFVIGCMFLVAGYFAEPPLKYALLISGLLIAVAGIPLIQLGTYGHGPYGIWPIKSPNEAELFDAMVLSVGERRFRIAVLIAVVVAIILILLS